MSELVLFPEIYQDQPEEEADEVVISVDTIQVVAVLLNMREALYARADELSDKIDEELRRLGLVESDRAVENNDFDAALAAADVPEFEVNLVRKET